jgi:hypothetical protein
LATYNTNSQALSFSFVLLTGFVFVFLLSVTVFWHRDKIKQNYLHIRNQGNFFREIHQSLHGKNTDLRPLHYGDETNIYK